ncbi:sensor histidine kinase [Oceanobacillus manasiensis]|uniref:sensor histidine kinase n=1 Tax=Oceanobacillus manasiensis TaxID=586413 RepID=UPI0005A5E71A|nr:HAMP domain-containing histidine kinase [Oceanobacillus manasiensis]
MKLRTKIQLFSSIFILLLLLLVNMAIYFLFYKISTDSQLEQLAEQTSTIVEAINNDPATATNEFMKAYLPQDGMIRIVDQQGTAFLTELNEDYSFRDPIFTETERQEIVSSEGAPDVAVIAKPIIWNNGSHANEVVTIEVSSQLTPLEETMQTLFFVLIAASIIMLIPIIIAGNVLSRFLLKPIKALIQAMRENMQQTSWKKINVESRSKDELYEMEMTFNEMIDFLKESYEKQEIFVSDASHELKTPISIVKSYAQLLKRRGTVDQELVAESLEAIDSEADRMQKLVEQMLALAKNKQVREKEDVNLAKLVEQTVQTFQKAYDRDIQYKKQDGEQVVRGLSAPLQQVVYILIDNALKYSQGKIDVKLFAKDTSVVLSVQDYGNGISEKDQSRIFDRFYRVDKARSRDTGGTGLGLAIAKSITEAHQGELTVNSIVGEGTTFFLTLPRSQ